MTDEKLDAVYNDYRGSAEEKADVLREYERHQGRMHLVYAYVICSDEVLDNHRFMDMVDEAIKADEVESFPSYKRWRAKVVKTKRPTSPLKKRKSISKKQSGDDESALVAAIQGRVCLFPFPSVHPF